MKNKTIHITIYITMLLFTLTESCVTIKKQEMHNPFYNYVITIQKNAIATKENVNSNFSNLPVYKYSDDEVLEYQQSKEGNLIYITKHALFLEEDIQNLKEVCVSCKSEVYTEKLEDGRTVYYKILQNPKTMDRYTIEIRIK